MLWGWENERRGTIANVTDGVRVRAGTGTQGSSPGPLNQELFTERRKRPLFIKLSQVSCSCLASLILELLWKDPQRSHVSLGIPVGSLQCLPGPGKQSQKACSRVESFAKDTYGVMPCTFGSNCSLKKLGKTVALLFSSYLFSLMGATIGLHLWILKFNSHNCFCSLT